MFFVCRLVIWRLGRHASGRWQSNLQRQIDIPNFFVGLRSEVLQEPKSIPHLFANALVTHLFIFLMAQLQIPRNCGCFSVCFCSKEASSIQTSITKACTKDKKLISTQTLLYNISIQLWNFFYTLQSYITIGQLRPICNTSIFIKIFSNLFLKLIPHLHVHFRTYFQPIFEQPLSNFFHHVFVAKKLNSF